MAKRAAEIAPLGEDNSSHTARIITGRNGLKATDSHARSDAVMGACGKFSLLALVPLLHRTQVSDYPGINLGFDPTGRAVWCFTSQIPVVRANGKRRGEGKIGQPVSVAHRFDERANRARVGSRFAQKGVQHRPAGIFCLQLILKIQHFKNVVGIVYR